MKKPRLKYANLDDSGLEKVRVMEEQTNAVVLVMETQLPIASLSQSQIERLKTLEEELNVVLVAYQS
jgi:hypothetical protein